MWSLASGRRLDDLPGFPNWGAGIALSCDGRTLASVGSMESDDRYRGGLSLIRLHDLRRGREIGTIMGKHVRATVVHRPSVPTGSFLAASRSVIEEHHGFHLDHQIILFEVATRREVLRIGHGHAARRHALQPGWPDFARGERRMVAVAPFGVCLGCQRRPGGLPPGPATKGIVLRGDAVSGDGATLAASTATPDGTVLLRRWAWPAPWQPWQSFRLSSEQQQQNWTDLASLDSARAYRAAGLLLRDPGRAVPLLRRRLRRAEHKVDARLISRLITDLDSDDFAVRVKARLGLEQQGDLAEPALNRALDERPALELRMRIDRLLTRLERAGQSPERLRVLRAVAVLERIGTAGAGTAAALGWPKERPKPFRRDRRWPRSAHGWGQRSR